MHASVEMHASLEGIHRRPGYRGFVANFITRTKRSALGRLAREWLSIDRSAPDKTVKYHRVDEQQDDGTWQTVHEHTVESTAKRR
jgi:hypothetical protein